VELTGEEGLNAGMSPDSLKQVLLNLVQNAREALRSGGTNSPQIGVSVRGAPEGVIITVEDNGPGVPQELRTRIFDPFFTTKSAVDGVGLGLFVAEGLVRSAGGRLTLDRSTSGARFVVELPKATTPTIARDVNDATVTDSHR
jgi:C4-dicarboxylate-specific signal transduction histidine kinase